MENRSPGQFPETHWSVVWRAGREDDPRAFAALCEAYWFPVYCFLRRLGAPAEDAADLTQGLFASLLSRDDLAWLDPELGRFRSWLRGAAKHFYSNAVDRERALKRGGKALKLAIDAPGAEARLGHELMHTLTPERLFDRCWARTVTERARASFEAECDDPGDLVLMDEILEELRGERPSGVRHPSRPPLSNAERVTRHRRRKRLEERYRRHLRREILGTVEDSSAIDDEIRVLLDVITQPP